jgi:hypothetical protein
MSLHSLKCLKHIDQWEIIFFWAAVQSNNLVEADKEIQQSGEETRSFLISSDTGTQRLGYAEQESSS